jgi:hypothetical protein
MIDEKLGFDFNYKVRIPIAGKATGKSYGARTLHAVFSAD